MQGIDRDDIAASQLSQQTALYEIYLMRRAVLLLQGILGILLVALVARHFVNELMQRAT